MGRKEWGVSSGEWRMHAWLRRCVQNSTPVASSRTCHTWSWQPGVHGVAFRVQMGRHPGCRLDTWGYSPDAPGYSPGASRTADRARGGALHSRCAGLQPGCIPGCSLGAWARVGGHESGNELGTSWARARHAWARTAAPAAPPSDAARRSAWSIVCSSSDLGRSRSPEMAAAPTAHDSTRRRRLASS